jgi:hypothetical protein
MKTNEYEYEYEYEQKKVSLSNLSFFSIKSIPSAERWGLGGMAASFVLYLAEPQVGALVLTLAAANYIYQKYHPDQAGARYYDEIKGVTDPKITNEIYRSSENVKIMGGSDAINNACATRIFNF